MASIDTVAASHPYLQAERMTNGLGWLLYALAQARWHQDDHGTTAGHGCGVHLATHFGGVL